MKTLLIWFAFTSLAIAADPQPTATNSHLWARVTVNTPAYVPNPLHPEFQHFYVTLWLVNDGEQTVKPNLDDSKIMVNGKEIKDSAFILGNGPRHISWEILKAHEVTDASFSLAEELKEPGTYRISWKGQGFESPEVSVRVLDPTVYLGGNDGQPLSTNKNNIIMKLNVIKLPELDLGDNTVGDLAELLAKDSVMLDEPQHKGVKIELHGPQYISLIKPGRAWHNLPLITALEYITRFSGLRYNIEDDKVVIHE